MRDNPGEFLDQISPGDKKGKTPRLAHKLIGKRPFISSNGNHKCLGCGTTISKNKQICLTCAGGEKA